MPRHQLTQEERRRGGKTTASLPAPGPCPRCGRRFESHLQYAGHLGLHGFADRYTEGDLKAAGLKLGIVGAAAIDPFPENGAFAEGHQFLVTYRDEEHAWQRDLSDPHPF
jgi:hypothetical protein